MEYKDYFKKESVIGKIKNPPKGLDADPKELQAGEADELEHTNDPKLASIISKHHLKDDPHYYSKLKGAGLEQDECGMEEGDAEEHCGACEDDMAEPGSEYINPDSEGYPHDDFNGGLPKLGGALSIPHLGDPIRMAKIISVGSIGNGPANGELSGYSNVGGKSGKGVAKDQGGLAVTPDSEPITAGGKKIDSGIATKTVGGSVAPGEGQKQGGKNTVGTIADTAKLDESKQKVRKIVKEVLKEITFDKKSGKWIRIDEGFLGRFFGGNQPLKIGDDVVCIAPRFKGQRGKIEKISPNGQMAYVMLQYGTLAVPIDVRSLKKLNSTNEVRIDEAGHKAGCTCGFCKNKGNFGKKKKEDKKEEDEGTEEMDETVDMKMGPSYKTVQPRMYKVQDDDFARTNQYEPEISEPYDEEEECKMQERYTELVNVPRNLNETELAEIKELHEKMDRMQVAKRNYGLSQGGTEPNLYQEGDKWIQKAVKHPGRCTPMSKPGCTGHARALAKRFKSGDLSEYKVGKVYNLSESKVNDLLKRGYKLEII